MVIDKKGIYILKHIGSNYLIEISGYEFYAVLCLSEDNAKRKWASIQNTNIAPKNDSEMNDLINEIAFPTLGIIGKNMNNSAMRKRW